jgi:hypothetical protein
MVDLAVSLDCFVATLLAMTNLREPMRARGKQSSAI